ncbi:BRO1-like domain-containing protein [Gaertneriomyces semiglobifer]|nr:BRO1-like domain-containing protein [Gaertneriomyces semiglobifer]
MAASLQSPMLHPPTKKTDDVDFASSFRAYIATVYQDDPDKYTQEIGTLNRFRQDTRGAGKDLTGRDILYRYYGQLELLDLRFPVDEKHVKVLFTWYDAFSQKSISQHSVAYEKACTIFNIAAVVSAVGALQNRFESSGLKTAFNYFQAAAGLFMYINDNFLHAPSVDMSRDSVKCLADLMLGQAQECFIEKVLGERKSGALVAKLAAQAAHQYGNVVDVMCSEAIKSQWDKPWVDLVKIKAKYFLGVSLYHKSMQCEADAQYGENVAYLTQAETVAKEANKMATSFSSSYPAFTTAVTTGSSSSSSSSGHTTAAAAALVEATKTSLNLITDRKNTAIKDNEMIYHASVPKIETLAPVEKLNAVKTLSFADICTNGQADIPKIIGPDIFQKLVPLSVHESASLYSEEKAKLLRGEQAKAETADDDLQATIASLDLMATIDKLKQHSKKKDPFPDEIRQWSEEVRRVEGESPTQTLINKLNDTKMQVKEALDAAGFLLDKEQAEFSSMQQKYGNEWAQSPSHPHTSRMREDLKTHRTNFERADVTDTALFTTWSQTEPTLHNLKLAPGELQSAVLASMEHISSVGNLIDSDGFSALDEQVLIEKIEGIMQRLRGLKKERAELVDELKGKIMSDDITSLLLLNRGREKNVFETELAKFRPLQSRLGSNLSTNRHLLQELSTEFGNLKETSQTLQTMSTAQQRREQIVSEFQTAFSAWRESRTALQRGLDFYIKLQDMTESLKRGVTDFCNKRGQERQELVSRAEQALAGKRAGEVRGMLEKLSLNTGNVPTASSPLPTMLNSGLSSASLGGAAPAILPANSPGVNTDLHAAPGMMSPPPGPPAHTTSTLPSASAPNLPPQTHYAQPSAPDHRGSFSSASGSMASPPPTQGHNYFGAPPSQQPVTFQHAPQTQTPMQSQHIQQQQYVPQAALQRQNTEPIAQQSQPGYQPAATAHQHVVQSPGPMQPLVAPPPQAQQSQHVSSPPSSSTSASYQPSGPVLTPQQSFGAPQSQAQPGYPTSQPPTSGVQQHAYQPSGAGPVPQQQQAYESSMNQPPTPGLQQSHYQTPYGSAQAYSAPPQQHGYHSQPSQPPAASTPHQQPPYSVPPTSGASYQQQSQAPQQQQHYPQAPGQSYQNVSSTAPQQAYSLASATQPSYAAPLAQPQAQQPYAARPPTPSSAPYQQQQQQYGGYPQGAPTHTPQQGYAPQFTPPAAQFPPQQVPSYGGRDSAKDAYKPPALPPKLPAKPANAGTPSGSYGPGPGAPASGYQQIPPRPAVERQWSQTGGYPQQGYPPQQPPPQQGYGAPPPAQMGYPPQQQPAAYVSQPQPQPPQPYGYPPQSYAPASGGQPAYQGYPPQHQQPQPQMPYQQGYPQPGYPPNPQQGQGYRGNLLD